MKEAVKEAPVEVVGANKLRANALYLRDYLESYTPRHSDEKSEIDRQIKFINELPAIITQWHGFFIIKLVYLHIEKPNIKYPFSVHSMPSIPLPAAIPPKAGVYYMDGFFIVYFNYNDRFIRNDAFRITDSIYYNDKAADFKHIKAPLKAWESVNDFITRHKQYVEPIAAYKIKEQQEQQKIKSNLGNDLDPYSAQLRYVLRPFQVTGVQFVHANKKVLNADDMGLGKTIQTIAAIHTIPDNAGFPCLIVCPVSLKQNWANEIRKWTNRRVTVVESTTTLTKGIIPKLDFVIMNYDILHKFSGLSGNFASIVADESHKIKEKKTRTYINFELLSRGTNYRIMLSGTPFLNRPKELITQLGVLEMLDKFGGESGFWVRYCNTKKDCNKNLPELKKRLENFMIRRLKSEVLHELPTKDRQLIDVDLTSEWQKAYNFCKNDFVGYKESIGKVIDSEVKTNETADILAQISYLRQISGLGKVAAANELIESIVQSGNKVVVFANHRAVIDALMIANKKYGAVAITGAIKGTDRENNVRRFQQDPDCMVIICNIKAAGVGLTLTAACYSVFVEYAWTPGELDQCEDRTYRIGQANATMNYYLTGRNTIDGLMLQLIGEKRELFNAAIGDTDKSMAGIDHESGIIQEFIKQAKINKLL